MSAGILNGEAAGAVDDEKCLLWMFAKRIKFAKKFHKFPSEIYKYFVLNSFLPHSVFGQKWPVNFREITTNVKKYETDRMQCQISLSKKL